MALPRLTITGFRVALTVTLVVIMYLATTEQNFAVIDDANDKVTHVLAFLVLAFLADYSTPKTKFNLNKGLLVLAYGLVIEVIQYFLPYRESSLYDLAADGIGVVMYVFSLPIHGRIYLLKER